MVWKSSGHILFLTSNGLIYPKPWMLTNCSSLTRRLKVKLRLSVLQVIHEVTASLFRHQYASRPSFPRLAVFSLSYMQGNLSFISFLSNSQDTPLIKRQHAAENVPKSPNFERAGWPGSHSITIFSEVWTVFMPLLPKYLIILNLHLKLLQSFLTILLHTNTQIHMYMYINTYISLPGLVWCRFPVMPSTIFSLTEGTSVSLIFQFII